MSKSLLLWAVVVLGIWFIWVHFIRKVPVKR